MTCKTLFIGLDGAEPQLIREWADQGHLPKLASLLNEYQALPIHSPKGFGDGGLWSSLVTGVLPGRHGHYFPKQLNSDTYNLDSYSIDDELGRDPFWFFLSKVEKTVGVVDIYTSPLRTGLRGIQVMDWMIHDRMGQPRSWPASLIDTLQSKYMADPLDGNTEVESRDLHEFIDLHQGVIDRIKSKTSACVDLIRDNPWDFFAVGYCDAHDIGHQSWHWHDSAHPRHPADWVKQYGNPLLQTYQALDSAIADLMEQANPTDVFIVSGLGMDQQSLCNSGLQQILAHYCEIDTDRDSAIQQRKSMPFFELPHNMHAGAVRINLEGRESAGVVAEKDYQATLQELKQKLLTLKDADTGEFIVEEVVLVADSYPGPLQNRLPDLFVVWRKPLATKAIRVDADTVIELAPVYDFEFRAGDHSNRASLLTSNNYQADYIKAESIAATICATLGVNLPDSDGQRLPGTRR